MTCRNRTFTALIVVSFAASYWGCGDSSSPSAPTPVAAVPTPTPCAQSVVFQGSGEMPAGTLLNFPVTVSAPARLDVQADWTFTTNPVGLFMIQGACSLEQFNARSCNFLLRIEPGAKPLKGSAMTPAGSFTVFVANFGTRSDSGTLQVVQSVGACAPATSAWSAGSTSSSGNLQVGRVQMFR
ncbi:MAG: hypothetical protein JJE39_12025 [Vicinamibacteria bacterium]|nr:hypothetical protein [Vicinamibacteria bacterium]